MVGAGLDPRRAGLVVAVLVAATPISAPASTVADRYTFQNVRIGGTGLVTGIVFSEAQRDPAYARTDVGGAYAAFSTDGGVTWTQGTEPSGINTGGSIAAAADGTRFVWAPGDSGQPVVYSTDLGGTWEQSTGVPANAMIASDRVNPMKFYAYDNGTFSRVSSVENADNIGFGKPAPGRSCPTLYTAARVDGVRGIFRSDDVGRIWVRINDDQHQTAVSWKSSLAIRTSTAGST
jgi:hypothetical protein